MKRMMESIVHSKKTIIIILGVLITFIAIGFIISITNSFQYDKRLLLVCFMFIAVLFFVIISKFIDLDIEKLALILFVICIPISYEKDFFLLNDYHMVTKEYYTFNIMHIFAIFFLIEIITNIKKVKIHVDLVLLFVFNIILIYGVFTSLNNWASFFDYIRYFIVTLIYIYFSRIFDYKKYIDIIINTFVFGAIFQFIVGILQILRDGPVGLYILGEGSEVFRLGVSNYEKGFSGTLGHPGNLGLYALLILSWCLFSVKYKKDSINFTGIIISTLIIIIAAGRTAILIMVLVYFIYTLKEAAKFEVKKMILLAATFLILIIIMLLFKDYINEIINRFTASDMGVQVENRYIHIELGITYFQTHPIFGIGLNNYLDYTSIDFPESFYNNFYLSNPIHNVYILYLAEIGISGLVVYVISILSNLVYYFKTPSTNRVVISGFLIALLCYAIYNFQGWGGLFTRSLIMIYFNSALIYNIYSLSKDENEIV